MIAFSKINGLDDSLSEIFEIKAHDIHCFILKEINFFHDIMISILLFAQDNIDRELSKQNDNLDIGLSQSNLNKRLRKEKPLTKRLQSTLRVSQTLYSNNSDCISPFPSFSR